MIKLKDILNEAPVDVHQTIGNFSKGSSFTHKQDRALVTSPVSVQKVRDFFKNTVVDFDFYFVNTKEARNFTEVGKVDENFIYTKLKITPEQLKDGGINYDNITVFFTNNKGAERVPLTAWVLAHRFGHVVRREHRWNDKLEPWLESKLSGILGCYGVQKVVYNPYTYGNHGSGNYNSSRKYKIALRHLCETIGTFKSARDKNLRAEFEFNYEIFAQYLNTGNVTFNPLPEVLLVGHSGWGRKSHRRIENMDHAQTLMDELTHEYPRFAESVLAEAQGNIFVM